MVPPSNFLESSSGPFPTSLVSFEGVAPREVPQEPSRKKFQKFHLRNSYGAVSNASPLDHLEQEVSSGIAISAFPGPILTKLTGDLKDTPKKKTRELEEDRPTGGRVLSPQRKVTKSEICASLEKKGGKPLTALITVRSLSNSLETCRGACRFMKWKKKYGSSLDFSSCGGSKSKKRLKTGGW